MQHADKYWTERWILPLQLNNPEVHRACMVALQQDVNFQQVMRLGHTAAPTAAPLALTWTPEWTPEVSHVMSVSLLWSAFVRQWKVAWIRLNNRLLH